jgi:hypothetical protein
VQAPPLPIDNDVRQTPALFLREQAEANSEMANRGHEKVPAACLAEVEMWRPRRRVIRTPRSFLDRSPRER